MKKFYWLMLSALFFLIISCADNTNDNDGTNTATTPVLSYSIISTLPHDTSSFTEGLEFYNNTILESTGLEGKSKLLQYDPATGKILKQIILDPKYFGEGITVLHDTLYQMTYKNHVVFVYNAKDLKKMKELPSNYDGWGLTNDGKNLIASDGSSNLYFYEPGTFRLLHTQGVTENGVPVININELEYINGFVYANQWQLNDILKINPVSGEVVAKMDLTDMVKKTNTNDSNVLNGIAYNHATNKIYVTGKNWPLLYEVQFDH